MKAEPSHVEIKYIQGEYQYGRAMLFGQLHSVAEDKVIIQRGSLAQILQFVAAHKLIIVNAQDVLRIVIMENGFAS